MVELANCGQLVDGWNLELFGIDVRQVGNRHMHGWFFLSSGAARVRPG
jgi:hypothetical protein